MTPTNNPSEWVVAKVADITSETPTVKTFTFELPRPVDHLPGQHYEVRLTAPDGYQAARLYSAASAATGDHRLQLTVALLADGEVSPYLHNQLQVGDQLELRGPLGRFFIWKPEMPEALALVAGGSGIVPLRCILQARKQAGARAPVAVLYSTSTLTEVIYKDELLTADSPATITLTQEYPTTWQGRTGRINAALLTETLHRLPDASPPLWYVCGSTPFVEYITTTLLTLAVPAERIKAERYGGEDISLA